MDIAVRSIEGTWRGVALTGNGTLRLGDEAVQVLTAAGSPVAERYPTLSGAIWHGNSLSLHALVGSVRLEAADGLDRAWVRLTGLACPLPEFTRALRSLGSRRGGDAERQSRFFAPLLQARRRLEDENDLERRLAVFESTTLATRMSQVLDALAVECYPQSPPDRRALEAELSDAAAPLFVRLQGLRESERGFRESTEEQRFVAWRAWLDDVSGVFAAADRAWTSAAVLLPRPSPRARGRWRGGTRLLAIASLGFAARWWA